jgi:hypothetical protein
VLSAAPASLGQKFGTKFVPAALVLNKNPAFAHLQGFLEAAEGIRTLDLLHGKQTL